MSEIIIINILRTAVISSIGISFILILKKTLFKQYTKSFNYYIWLIVIFRMILPFKIPIYISTNSVISNYVGINDSINTIKSISDSKPKIESINNSLNSSNQVIESSKIFNTNFSLLEILSYVWLIVALFIVIYRIFTYIKFKNTLVDLSCAIKDTKVKTIYTTLLIEMKINKNIILKVSDYTSVPLGIGIFKSYIVLPSVNYDEKEAKWILKHELMHYKKHDIIYKFLVMGITSIYWFNPLIYLMNRYINIDCELACDEKILHRCDFKERQHYALTLINSLKHKENNFLKTNLATKLGNKKILKRRFESMFNKKSNKGIFIGVLAIIVAICSFVVISNNNDSNIVLEKKGAQTNLNINDDSIVVHSIYNSNYKGYYLEITDPTSVKIGCSSKLMTEGETTSQIAKNNDAIAAINGGGYTNMSASDTVQRESDNAGIPTGFVITGGKVIYTDLEDNEKTDAFAITKEGVMVVGNYSINDLTKLGAQEALSYGPPLVLNGKMADINGDIGVGITARTAIGQKKDGTIIMMTIDGTGVESLGTSLDEVQEIMFKLGAFNAITLTGGNSTTMYYGGNIINNPSGSEGENSIPTAIIVKSAENVDILDIEENMNTKNAEEQY